MNAKLMSSIVAALLVAGAMAEDREITESYTLTADEVVDGTLTVAAGADVNLNGYSLMVSGLAGSGGIMSSVLPAGYVELEYVEATGEQYIDTGYTPTDAVKVETDIAYTGTTGSSVYRAVLAASDSNAYVHFGLWVWPNSGSKWTVTYDGNSTCYANTAVTVGTKYKIVAAWASGAQSVSANGTSRSTTLTSTTSISHTMYLPARNNNGTAKELSSCKIYGLKLYKPQSTLVRNYVPAKRSSDDAVGLYDLVSDTFFPSESSTAFVAGPEIGRGGGELQLNVASGVTLNNSTVAISNTVKVVKLGAGTYESAKTQTYTGGTVVTNGHIGSKVSLGFGARGSTFDVSGAQVVISGRNATLDGYDVTIANNGVAPVLQGNTKISSGWQKSFLKSLTLSGDASISSWGEDALGLTYSTGSIQPFTLTLNGHTLWVVGNSRLCANQVTVPDEGTIVVERNAGTTYTDLYPRGTFNAPLVTLDVRANAKMYGDAGFVVSNLVYAGTGGSKSSTVLGTYTPKVTSSLPTVVLGNGTHLTPTLDLGNVSAVIGNVTFTDGSTVTVDAGSRTLNIGDKLVSWSEGNAPDSSVSFVLCTNGVAVADRTLTIKDDFDGRGLYVKNATEPAYAQFVGGQWKYFAEDGTEYEGEWTGGVTDMMDVRFSTVAEYEATCATNFSPLAFVMATNNFVNTSGGTCDLTTLGTFGFTAGTALDANGGCIKVPTTMAGGATAFTVTNSSDQVGTLELEVSSGDIVSNTVMKIAGNIKFVKEGAGTYCADKKNYYTGGTVVNEGIITGTTSLGGSYGFGTRGSSVEIKDGAQALINGVNSVLNGYEVTIEGSGPDGNGAIYGNLDAGMHTTPFIQGLLLSSNATINVVAEDAFNLNNNCGTTYVALNGYELTLADTGRIILWSVNVTNEGSIVASIDPGNSATNICVYTMGNGLSAPLADVTVPSGKAVGGSAAYVVSNMTFGGVWSGKSGASLTVLGYYKPTSTATSYPPTTLGDATHLNPALDLSEMSTAYDGSGLSFVDNATVTIKFGERSVQCGTKIVDWTDNAPSNLSGLTFVWGEGKRQYFVVKKSDGLYIHHAFVLLVR